MNKERSDEIIGKKVRVRSCEAREHSDNPGCVCHLIGQVVTIEKRYDTPFVGTASYHIKGMKQRVRRSEVTLLRKQENLTKLSETMNEKPGAIIREVDGQLVLDDPDALAMICAVGKHNCKGTLELNADRVKHFRQRVTERRLTASDVVIVLLNVDDVHGGPLADMLMPGMNWQEIRDRGEVPFARGLAGREGIQEVLEVFDLEAATKLRGMQDVAVVVVDHGVAEVFSS